MDRSRIFGPFTVLVNVGTVGFFIRANPLPPKTKQGADGQVLKRRSDISPFVSCLPVVFKNCYSLSAQDDRLVVL